MRTLDKMAVDNLQRHYRSRTHWYIPHDAGQLKISITKVCPSTDDYVPWAISWWNGDATKTLLSIANEADFKREYEKCQAKANNRAIYYDPGELEIMWVLPDGSIIEGASIDTEVVAGETLCICKDFRATDIKVDCKICRIDYRDMPVCHSTCMPRKTITSLADYPSGYDAWNESIGRVNAVGEFCFRNSKTRGTTKDMARILAVSNRRIIVNYCPDITGDLAEIKSWMLSPSWIRGPLDEERIYFSGYKDGVETTDWTPDEVKFSFHHCGVHGVPQLKNNQSYDWEYYACPNARPEDFDGLIEQIIHNDHLPGTVDGVGWCYYDWRVCMNTASKHTLNPISENPVISGYSFEAGQPIVPAYGTLKISNRTADPVHRANRISQLRTAGWIVEEIDDSLEDGIYAAHDEQPKEVTA